MRYKLNVPSLETTKNDRTGKGLGKFQERENSTFIWEQGKLQRFYTQRNIRGKSNPFYSSKEQGIRAVYDRRRCATL